jgi:hypothetical protein
MIIQNLNWEWAMDTLDMLRQSVEEATATHDAMDLARHQVEGEPPLRLSIRRSLKSVQHNLADSVVSIRGLLSDQDKISALYRKKDEEKPDRVDPDDIPF